MAKHRSVGFIITNEIKKELNKKICTYLNLKTEEEINDFFLFTKHSASPKGGAISVDVQNGRYVFDFNKQGKGDYLIVKSNVVKYKSVLYGSDDMGTLKEIVSKDLEKMLNENLKIFYNFNRTYEALSPDKFELLNVKISKDKRVIFSVKYHNNLFKIYEDNSIKVENLDNYKNNFPSLRFKLDYKALLGKVNTNNFTKNIIDKYTNKNGELVIDFAKNTINMNNLVVRQVIVNTYKDKYELEDILNANFIKKINLAEKINKAIDKYKKEEDKDCQIKVSIVSINSVNNNIKLAITYKKNYIRGRICVETSYVITDETIKTKTNGGKIFKEILKELLEKYEFQREGVDHEIEEENKRLKSIKNNIDNLFKEGSYFENKELLVRSTILFINQNKFCSQTSLLQFLRGRKMSDYFKKTEGYGAFKDVKEEDVSTIISKFEDLEILKEELIKKYGSYCSIYKINNEVKNDIMSAISMSKIKKDNKHNLVYYVDCCNRIDLFTDENIDILAEILENESLVIYLKKKLAELIKKSDENIKQYVITLAEIETKKSVREALEFICKNINKNL